MSFPSDLISPPQNTSMKPVIPPHRQPVAPPKVDASNGKNVGNDRTQVIKIIWCICIYICILNIQLYIYGVYLYIYISMIYIYEFIAGHLWKSEGNSVGLGLGSRLRCWTSCSCLDRCGEKYGGSDDDAWEILAYTLWYIYMIQYI